MPKLLSDLLKDAKEAKEEGVLEIARFWLAYWSFLLWFHETTRKRFIRRIRVKRKFIQQASRMVLQKELKRSREIEKDARRRQIRFFTNILPDARWREIAKGQEEPTASDYHSLVRKYLSAAEPLPTGLVKPEDILLGSAGIFASISLHISASSAEYAYFTQEIVESIYQHRGASWDNSTVSFRVFCEAAQEWVSKEYMEHASDFSRESVEELRRVAEGALAPVLLCHFAFWIRKLNLSSLSWESFCIPEVVRDVCQFVLHEWGKLLWSSGTMLVVERESGRWVAKMRPRGIDFLNRMPLQGLSRPVVKGFVHLAQANPSSLSFLFGTQERKLKASASTPAIVMKRGGGLTALALLMLLQEEGVVESILSKRKELEETATEVETVLGFLFPPVKSPTPRSDEEVAFLQSLRPLAETELLQSFLEQALSGTTQEIGEIFQSAEYMWAFPSTTYFRDVQDEVVRRIDRAFARRKRNAVAEGLDPRDMVLGKMFELLCNFPSKEWKQSGENITKFVVEKLADMCREEYALLLKIKSEPTDFVTDMTPEEQNESEEAALPGESFLYHIVSETVRGQFHVDPLRTMDRLEFNKLYIAILRNSCLKERERKVLTIFLRECHWGRSRDVEEIHRIIATELKLSPENVRQIKRRALQIVGPELLSLLQERLSQ